MFNKLIQFFKCLKKEKSLKKCGKILLIEDNEVDCKVTINALEKNGFQTLSAITGEKGLSLAKTKRPDLILLDGALPDMDGEAVCKELKDTPETKHIPIIFLTGLDSPARIVDFYSIGAEQYLNKPVSPQILVKEIEKTLQRKNTLSK